ncbi:hypothetical protein FQN57_000383 [Myotisia sp. PD_48]|nr:hypothetical protein FQN57_000383 [Myotisia sp. PD_48]
MPPGRKGASQSSKKQKGSKKTQFPSTDPVTAHIGIPEVEDDPLLPTGVSLAEEISIPVLDTQLPVPVAVAADDDDKYEPEPEPEPKASRRRATSRFSEHTVSSEPAPDVFSFLEKGEKSPTHHSRKASEPIIKLQSKQQKERPRKASLSQLLRTVSGISSIRDLSPSRASSVASRDSEYQPPTPPDMLLDPLNMGRQGKGFSRAPMAGAYLTDSEPMLDGPTSTSSDFLNFSNPDSYYMPKDFPSYPVSPTTTKHSDRLRLDTSDTRNSIASRRRSMGSVSSKSISSHPAAGMPQQPPRIYRKFESLNHRVLRHLQDEITQLEDDLTTLDELEAAHNNPASTRSSPRQKILAAKYNDLHIEDYSVLQYKRNDLLDKMITKTEKYNRALCAFSKVMRTLPHASEKDIELYHTSVQAPSSTATKTERRILDHKADLVVMSSHSLASIERNPLYTTIAAISAAILFPLLAFGAISEFFGRILVVSFVAGTFAWWASNGPPGNEYLIDPQDGWKCAAL